MSEQSLISLLEQILSPQFVFEQLVEKLGRAVSNKEIDPSQLLTIALMLDEINCRVDHYLYGNGEGSKGYSAEGE